jgi:glucose/arabinose dehydrogenase
VASGDEGGLLGVAVDPSFESSRFFYVYATMPAASGTVNQVLRLRMSEDHSSAVVDRVLVDGIDAAKYHDGGRIRIGPDGLLYVGTGDARVPQRAQQAGSLNGKILRYRLDGSVPPDNPSAGSAVYVSGLRNTQGFDWLDARTLVVVDHGPSGDLGKRGLDEVHVARAGDNLGWPEVTGCDAAPGKASPLLSWKMAVPPGGAALYRGTSLAAWKDNLIIGTLGSRHLHRVVLDKSGRRVERHEVYLQGDPPAGYGRLREVVMGPDGHLYVTTSNCDGRGQCPPDKDKLLRVRAP